MNIIAMTIRAVVIVVFLFLSTGCSQTNRIDDDDFVYTVTLNGFVYGLSDETVPQEKIGDRIVGAGTISCKYSECPDPNARIFYQLKDTSLNKAIAREVQITEQESVFKKCIKIRKAKAS